MAYKNQEQHRESERLRALAWRIEHPEKAKASTAKWRNANRRRMRAAVTAWNTANRERKRQTDAVWHAANRERTSHRKSLWKQQNRDLNAASTAKRKATLLQATPAWADQTAIAAIYTEAAARGMHVDHIVPLQSKLVCGLHVHNNLQPLPGVENLRKGNRHWPDMP